MTYLIKRIKQFFQVSEFALVFYLLFYKKWHRKTICVPRRTISLFFKSKEPFENQKGFLGDKGSLRNNSHKVPLWLCEARVYFTVHFDLCYFLFISHRSNLNLQHPTQEQHILSKLHTVKTRYTIEH